LNGQPIAMLMPSTAVAVISLGLKLKRPQAAIRTHGNEGLRSTDPLGRDVSCLLNQSAQILFRRANWPTIDVKLWTTIGVMFGVLSIRGKTLLETAKRATVTFFCVTYCPLSASALPFHSRLDGKCLTFENHGDLYECNLVMYDRGTDSLWYQLGGMGLYGVPPRSTGFGRHPA
jgi:hypothetical protein